LALNKGFIGLPRGLKQRENCKQNMNRERRKKTKDVSIVKTINNYHICYSREKREKRVKE
jgi:hypothetical protein